MELNPRVKYNRLFVHWISIITIVILLLAVFSNLTANTGNIEIFFCSDTLYLPSLYRDLFIDKNSISGWELNPAPNYFPDMLVYFLLMFITNDFIIASFVFSIVQYVILGFLFTKILRVIFPSASAYYNMLIYALLSFFILEFFFFTKDFYYIFLILVNSYHTGAFVMMLLCTYLTFQYIQDRKLFRLLLIFCIGFLMMLSDKLFLVLYVAPVCFTMACMFKKTGLRPALYLISTCALFVYSGNEAFNSIDKEHYNLLGTPGNEPSVDKMLQQFGTFLDQMKFYLGSYGIRSVILCLFVVSFTLMVYVFIHSLRKAVKGLVPVYALFSISFSLGVLCAPMIAGKYEGWDCIRYNAYPFYFTVLNVAVFFGYSIKSDALSKFGRYGLLSFTLLLLGIGVWQLKPAGLKAYFNYCPANARLVDELADRENLKFGVGNYWEAKEITMFSKKGVKVYAVFDDIALYLHVANDAWFFDNMFNFVVLNDFKDTTLYRTKLKDIRYVTNTPQLKLVKTRPFFYNRIIGGTAINTEIKEK